MINDPKIRITKITAASAKMGKGYSLTETGELEKHVVRGLSAGEFETVDLKWSEFGSFLSSLTPSDVLVRGVCNKRDQPGNVGSIITKGRVVTKAREDAMTEELKEGETIDFVSRTKKNFSFHVGGCDVKHNVLMVDIDLKEALGFGPKEEIGFEDVDAVVERVLTAYPALTKLGAKHGCWVFPSAGSCIYKVTKVGEVVEEVQVKGIGGLHLYFLVGTEIGIGAGSGIKKYFTSASWLAGEGVFTVEQTEFMARVREYCLVDTAVFEQPEHQDFIGGAWCGEGLVQRRGAPVFYEIDAPPVEDAGGVSADGAVFTVDHDAAMKLRRPAELEARERARRLSEEIEQASIAEGGWAAEENKRGRWKGSLSKFELPLDFEVKVGESGERLRVWELILDPGRWTGKYFHDPLEPEAGWNKCRFFWDKENPRSSRYVMASFLHGGIIYRFAVGDAVGIAEMIDSGIKKAGLKSLEDIVAERPWILNEIGMLSAAQVSAVLDKLKEKGIGNKKDMKLAVDEHSRRDRAEKVKEELAEKLARLNQRFAYVSIEGKARYIEDKGDGWEIRDRGNFLAELENEGEVVVLDGGAGGKPKVVPLALAWLQWEDRKQYPGGFTFNPNIMEREYMTEKGLTLNRFRGFNVKPIETGVKGFGCRGEKCGGVGCLAWSFNEINEGREGLCSVGAGNWTYWVRTVYDVACGNIVGHEEKMAAMSWIIGWFCDIIQNPGGKGEETKSGVGLVLRGGQGTGKDSIIKPFLKLLAPHSLEINSMDQLTAQFNSFLEDNLLIHGAEAVWGGSKKDGQRLKQLMTSDQMKIERKGIDAYWARNHVRFAFSSNADWVIPAEEDERRYTVFDTADTHKQDRSWFAKVWAGNLRELMTMALVWQGSADVYRHLPTQALRDQKQEGQDIVFDFVEKMLETGEIKMGTHVTHTEITEKYQEWFGHRRFLGETPEQFKRRFRKALAKRGWDLEQGVVGGKVKSSGGRFVRGFLMPDEDWFRSEFIL